MMSWEEVRVLDVNSEYLGVPTETLMENAGWALAQEITARYGEGLHIAILCGTGNNGGDGFVAARALTRNNRVRVYLASPPSRIRTPEARVNFEKVEELHKIFNDDDLTIYDIVVDALVGIGSKGDLREQYAKIARSINDSGRTVISLDLPSGLGTADAVHPTLTVTFHALKEGMNEKDCGEIVVREIGIPAEAEKYLGPGDLVHYPVPVSDTHKGQNGRVLVVGGGPYTGAPALSGLAAYRIGADLVFVACPENVQGIVASYSPNLITVPLSGDRFAEKHLGAILKLTEKVDAVLIGPGLGDEAGTLEAIRSLVAKCSKPMVLDADALKAMAGHLELLKGKAGVLTPHHRELEIMLGTALPKDLPSVQKAAIKIASDSGWTILVKGPVDLVTDGENVKLNRTGNAGMSVGGTGDVLAGITVGLLAKKTSPYNAARMSAYINGAAGDQAFEKYSYGIMATDLLDRIPQVLRKGLSRTL